MLGRTVSALFVLILATGVLFTSIHRTTFLKYSFSGPNDSAMGITFTSGVEYSLPYPGILPDHPVWFVKVVRDRLWRVLTIDPLKRANRTLFLADKRLIASKQLFEKGNFEMGVATAAKAERYLENALAEAKDAKVKGKNADGFFETLAKSALTHREILEEVTAMGAPEDAKSILNKTLDVPKKVYEQAVHELNEVRKPVPGVGE